MIDNYALREILKNITDPAVVCEIYSADSVPGAFGFNPAQAIARYSNVSGISFLGFEYEKLVSKFGKIKRTISAEVNRASVEFDNLSNEISRFEFSDGFEGLIKVIRLISRENSVSLATSLILFVGRCEKPNTGTKKSLSVTAKQIFGSVDAEIPRRKFTAEDVAGRVASDPFFEGFVYIPQYGSVSYNSRERRGGLLGFLGFKKTVTNTLPWSSFSDLDASRSVPYVLGRSQLLGVHLGYADIGTTIRLLTAFCEGEIADFVNVRSVNPQFPLDATNFAKLLGKTGVANGPPDNTWVAPGFYSRTAHTRSQANNSLVSVTDAAPDEVAVVIGLLMPIPNAARTAFDGFGWTDDAAAHTRFLMTDKELSQLDAGWIDEDSFLECFKYNSEFIFDLSYSDILFVPQGAAAPDQSYASTGLLTPEYLKYQSGDTTATAAFSKPSITKEYVPNKLRIDPIDPGGDPGGTGGGGTGGDPGGTGGGGGGTGGGGGGTGGGGGSSPSLNFYLRRRYTSNVAVTEVLKIRDFLHEVIFPSSRLFLSPSPTGKIKLNNKKPVDWALAENIFSSGTNSISIDDVSKWIANKNGFLLIDPHTNLSEIKTVTGANYSVSQNNVALSASTNITVTGFSGSNGANNAASATLLISTTGTASFFDLGGIRVDFNAGSGDTPATIAGFIYATINAHPVMKRRFSAVWNPGANTVLITAKFGSLIFSENLLLDHSAPIANPVNAPVLASAAGGALKAGNYTLAYSYKNQRGQTLLSPSASIILAANQQISVAAVSVPAGASVNWYIVPEANSTKLRYFLTNSGAAFNINTLPRLNASIPPDLNRTGTEVMRVSAVFSDRAEPRTGLTKSNVLQSSYKWMLGQRESSINEIRLKFRDATQDWKLVELRLRDDAHIAKTKKVSSKEINGQAVDNYNQAYRIASGLLAEYRDADFFYQFSADRENLLLEENDVVAVTDAGAEVVNFPVSIEDLDIDPEKGFPSINFTARKYSTTLYDDSVAERKIPIISEIPPENNAPNLQSVIYVPKNFTISRNFDAATATQSETANTLATVMDDLKNKRI